MRFKPVPPAPASLEAVGTAQRAVPLVPGSEADCCARLVRALALPSRDVARSWLTFMRALELVVETGSGFRRLRTDPTRQRLRSRLPERAFGARELLDVLAAADGPLDADAAFERFRAEIPAWERRRDPAGWEALWRERVGDLLDWLALAGLAERTREGYAVTTRA